MNEEQNPNADITQGQSVNQQVYLKYSSTSPSFQKGEKQVEVSREANRSSGFWAGLVPSD